MLLILSSCGTTPYTVPLDEDFVGDTTWYGDSIGVVFEKLEYDSLGIKKVKFRLELLNESSASINIDSSFYNTNIEISNFSTGFVVYIFPETFDTLQTPIMILKETKRSLNFTWNYVVTGGEYAPSGKYQVEGEICGYTPNFRLYLDY